MFLYLCAGETQKCCDDGEIGPPGPRGEPGSPGKSSRSQSFI